MNQVGCHPTIIRKWVSAYLQGVIQGLEKKEQKKIILLPLKKLINEVQNGLVYRRGHKSKSSERMSDIECLEEALKAEQRNSCRFQMENEMKQSVD